MVGTKCILYFKFLFSLKLQLCQKALKYNNIKKMRGDVKFETKYN